MLCKLILVSGSLGAFDDDNAFAFLGSMSVGTRAKGPKQEIAEGAQGDIDVSRKPAVAGQPAELRRCDVLRRL